jgi:hypothetical protein
VGRRVEPPEVERIFRPDPEVHLKALRLLLTGSMRKKAAGESGGEEAGRRMHDYSGNTSLP